MFLSKKWKEKLSTHMQLILSRKPMMRLFGVHSLTLLLGFSFAFIFQGITFGIIRLTPYSRVAYRIMAILMGITYHPDQFEPAEIKWFHYFSIVVGFIPSLFSIGAGIWFLDYAGICGQNPLCMIFGSII